MGRTWRYSCDANNNVIKATDPKAQVTTYSWDTGHQRKTRTEQGGRTTSCTRNALGQVLKVAQPSRASRKAKAMTGLFSLIWRCPNASDLRRVGRRN
ncbi:RHS repeat domain-containing protein [Aquabacterium sp.]|uniref:RHS repeat domain-containing protein n=1 Tax=Aquabacterium sp. TaxID=1872578 RepID=UPI00345B63F0